MRAAVQWERCTELSERACACPCKERGYYPDDETCARTLCMRDYHPRGRASQRKQVGSKLVSLIMAAPRRGTQKMTDKIPEPIFGLCEGHHHQLQDNDTDSGRTDTHLEAGDEGDACSERGNKWMNSEHRAPRWDRTHR